MSDPYRSAAFPCLECTDAPLRKHGERLVCDSCGGLLLELADFEASVADLTMEPVRIVDVDELERRCPRCDRKLVQCRLEVGKLRFDDELLRCHDHGLWFANDQLAEVFERISRREGRGVGGGRSYGGVGASWIRHRREARTPREPMFATAYGDRRIGCPACAERALVYGSGRWECGGCRGVFVEDDALAIMVAAMTAAPWELPVATGVDGPRVCPICGVAMLAEQLEGVPVDRCAGHGVWFDADELEVALAHTTEPPATGLRAWLRGLR